MVPTVLLPPATPLTFHVTVVLPVLPTVAVKTCVPVPGSNNTAEGSTLTATGGVIVTPMKPLAAGLAAETAVTVTTGLVGTFVGGV
jgi:hypothetical protein